MIGKTILVISRAVDSHADVACRALTDAGARFVRFHTADFPSSASMIGYVNDGRFSGYLDYDHGRLDFDDVWSAWYRRPDRAQFPDWPEGVQEFAQSEVKHTLRSMWKSIPGLWVSRPDNIHSASVKLPQLEWARQAGFEVPDTVVTNVPDEARRFYDIHDGRIICKAVYHGSVEYRDGSLGFIYTSLIRPEHLSELDRVRVLPCLLQEYVPKQVELRVTVFGRQVLAAEIHSQADERTMHDWRHYEAAVPYRTHALPDDVADCCVRLVAMLGLEFGALDLVLTPDGRYVFLEINPNGQWAWIEELTGLPLTRALLTLLIDGPRCPELTARHFAASDSFAVESR